MMWTISPTRFIKVQIIYGVSEAFKLRPIDIQPRSLVKSIHERHLNTEIAYPFVAPADLRVEDRALCDWINEMHICEPITRRRDQTQTC